MPAGCEFICNNFQCSQHKSGFVISAPWPMGKIELIISSLSKYLAIKPSNKAIIDKMIVYKKHGRKYACIIYPNKDNIPIAAYRIQLWSPKAKCVWDYDIENIGKSLQESIELANLPTICPKTNGPLLSFSEVTKEGIICPFCNEKLQQSRWFTNEEN